MSYLLKLLPEARSDILLTKDWYFKNHPDLSQHFFLQLSESIDYLSSNPKLFDEVYKDVRQVRISRSPFNIFFQIDEINQFIVILAVIHASDNPEVWKKRSEEQNKENKP
jgi:plasmid stabilization system protein ParE